MTAFEMVEEPRRVAAVTGDGVEICGAFQPDGHTYWHLYSTRLIYEATGVQTPPHREHFFGDNGRSCARLWVEMIAALYSHERVKPAVVGDCSGALANIEETA
jgi:hypothetical protein